ncbi:MAG: PilZ domain-containing protein [Candidatus Thiodiazotropha sp. (ex. Lucinoma kazani)]
MKRIESDMEKETRLVSNASDEFLQRIERQRLESECLHSLDLRASVEGPCKRFSYRGRSLWLDPDAHQLFLEGLKNNAGVFTVGTYESILERLNGESIETEQISVCGDQEAYESGSQATMATATPSPFESNWIANNLAIDLSYFEKRVYDRFKISLNMELLWNGQTYPAETRDISQSGMQLRLKMPVEVRESDQVRIAVMPSVGRQLLHPELDYRVLRIRRLLNDTLLALQCIEKEPKDGLMVISEHIAASSKATMSEQTDSEDALLTAQALLAERFYMRSTSILPFFLFEDQEIDSPLRIIFGNQVNKHSLRGFENLQGKYDFSSLVTPKRIKLLMRLAVRDSKADTLIAVYRSPDHIAPQVRADLECKNHKHWCRLLMRYIDQPGFRVFKVVARAARRPVEMRIEDAVGSLTDQDNEFVRKLLMDAKTLSIVGALIDVTEQVRDWRKGVCSQETSTVEDSIICCEDQQPLTPPQLVPICYIQENRSEDRFLGQMQVEVSIAGRIYQGETCDVSTHGLSVMMNKSGIAFESDHQATISFPKLESRSSSLTRIQGTFRNVPADIVSGAADGDRLLRFKISDVAKGRQFTNAFSNFLAKRQSRSVSGDLTYASCRHLASLFIDLCRELLDSTDIRLSQISQ